MANDKVYIHEFIDIIGHRRADYMHHMTANWSPIAQEERNQLCFGVWGIVGSTGQWPAVVNMWEEDGWDGLARSFGHELGHADLQDPKLARWWARAAKLPFGRVRPHRRPGTVVTHDRGAVRARRRWRRLCPRPRHRLPWWRRRLPGTGTRDRWAVLRGIRLAAHRRIHDRTAQRRRGLPLVVDPELGVVGRRRRCGPRGTPVAGPAAPNHPRPSANPARRRHLEPSADRAPAGPQRPPERLVRKVERQPASESSAANCFRRSLPISFRGSDAMRSKATGTL